MDDRDADETGGRADERAERLGNRDRRYTKDRTDRCEEGDEYEMVRAQFFEREVACRERVPCVGSVFDAVEGGGERTPVERNEAQRQREPEHAHENQQIRAMFG